MRRSRPDPHDDRGTSETTQKEWRRPELQKLPIAATANSQGKTGGSNSADGSNPKTADSNGQLS